MNNSSKQKALASKIKNIVSQAFLSDFENSLFKIISISDVEITNGGEKANIYFYSYKEELKDEIIKEVKKATTAIAHKITINLNVRKAPKIELIWDDKLDKINEIEKLLAEK